MKCKTEYAINSYTTVYFESDKISTLSFLSMIIFIGKR